MLLHDNLNNIEKHPKYHPRKSGKKEHIILILQAE